MIGVIVNTLAIVAGSAIGLLCKRGIPKKLADSVMTAVGLCVVYIGISGLMGENSILVLIFSMVLGAIVGAALDIDGWVCRLGDWVEHRFSAGTDGKVSLAQGFVTASLLFCVGAMAIVGSLNAGLLGDNQMLFTKSVLDFISAMMLSVSLGIGVMFAAAAIFLYQGAIVLLAGLLQPILNDGAVAGLSCAGSLLILALGLNMLGITKIKVANYMPVLIFVPLLYWVVNSIPVLSAILG